MEILAVKKTLNIDLYGPEKAVNCAEDSDVKQYLQVSATDSLYPEAGSGASNRMLFYDTCQSLSTIHLQEQLIKPLIKTNKKTQHKFKVR